MGSKQDALSRPEAVKVNLLWSKISPFPGRSAAHYESEFPQNLKGVDALANAAVRGFRSHAPALLAADVRPCNRL
jgi:hypothetical protein